MLKSRSFFQRRKDLWGENWGRMRKVWNVGCEKWKRELFTGQAMDSGWNVQNFGDLKEKCFPHTHTHAHTHTHTRAQEPCRVWVLVCFEVKLFPRIGKRGFWQALRGPVVGWVLSVIWTVLPVFHSEFCRFQYSRLWTGRVTQLVGLVHKWVLKMSSR